MSNESPEPPKSAIQPGFFSALGKRLFASLDAGDIATWRQKLAERLSLVAALLVPGALVIMLPFVIEHGQWGVFAFDVGIWLWFVLQVVYRKGFVAPSRVSVVASIFLATTAFHAFLGPGGDRPIWLLGTIAFGAIMFGMRGVLVTTAGCVLMSAATYLLIPASYPPWQQAFANPRETLMVISGTHVAAIIIGAAIASLMQAMERILDKLGASQKRYQLLADSATDVIWTADANLQFTYISPSVEQLRGYRVEEVMGQTVAASVTPESLPKLMELFGRQMELASVGDARGWDPFVVEADQPRKDGTTIVTSTHAKLTPGPDGHPASIVGVTRDVTQQKLAEELLAYETRFREVLGEIANSFITLSADEVDQGIDAALETVGRFVESDRCYVLRFDLKNALATQTHEWCREGISPVMEDHREISMEPFQWINDELIQLRHVAIPQVSGLSGEAQEARERFELGDVKSLLLVPLVSEGSCIGAVGFDYVLAEHSPSDIELKLLHLTGATLSNALSRTQMAEERQRLQAQLNHAQKMEAIGRLAGGVAHDFNNVLSAITGNTSLLQDQLPADDPVRQTIDEIGTAADRAAGLTKQLLAFSRKQIIDPKVVDLNALIGQLHPMLVRLIGEDITLRTHPNAAHGNIRIDPGQMEQIVMNLAVNARDAMPRGGQLIVETADISLDDAYCKRHMNTTPGEYVMLAVGDTGSGMSDDVRERIFEPFFTTKTLGKGTGLGLATVLGIVEQNHGHIEVYSELDQGTSLKLYFPRVEGKAEELPSAVQPRRVGGSETLLVVEDELTVRRVVVKQLRHLGYTVLSASCGEEALSLSNEHDGDIALLLTDLVMPNMNGRELSVKLTRLRPGLRVLYSSGYTDEVIAHHGVLEDGVQLLSKPYSLHTLAAKVREMIDAPSE